MKENTHKDALKKLKEAKLGKRSKLDMYEEEFIDDEDDLDYIEPEKVTGAMDKYLVKGPKQDVKRRKVETSPQEEKPQEVYEDFERIDKPDVSFLREAPLLKEGESGYFPMPQGEQFPFFWYDASEDFENRKMAGKVLLFGKRKAKNGFKSVLIIVNGITYDIYLSPRKEVLDDPDGELRIMTEARRLCSHIKKVKIQLVKKKYCFEDPSTPIGESIYCNIQYEAQAGKIALPKSNQIFQSIYGNNQSWLERFLLEKKIKGPSWLQCHHLTSPSSNEMKISHCEEEYVVEFTNIKKFVADNRYPDPPTLKMVSIKTQCVQSKTSNVISIVSALFNNSVSIEGPTVDWEKNTYAVTFVRNPFVPQAKVPEKSDYLYQTSEKDLIQNFFTKLKEFDPDVIVGHNFLSYDLDILLNRCKLLNISGLHFWSTLGKLKRSKIPTLQRGAGQSTSTYQEKQVVKGRLICDTYESAKEFLREKSNSLVNIAESQLKTKLQRVDNADSQIRPYFFKNEDIELLALNMEFEAYLTIKLAFKMSLLPMTRELSSIVGNVWSRTLVGSRAERVESLLLHEFYEKGYIVPNKKNRKTKFSGRKKAKYGGGKVIAPQTGLYEKYVLVLDFNSLYPSLILQHNICFTTVERPRVSVEEETKESSTAPPGEDAFLAQPPADKSHSISILPTVIKTLLNKRSAVKRELKNQTGETYRKWILDIQQKALKLVANSTYGCLGFSMSRFYCEPMAELITRLGRELLMMTKTTIENQGHVVVYGDTDSVMVLTEHENFVDALNQGIEIKNLINKDNNYLEIDIDGLFRRILLLQKKKYVAELHTPDPRDRTKYIASKEIKGVEIVRRDWCDLSKNVARFCVDVILSGKTQEEVVEEIHGHLKATADNIKNFPLDDFILYKGLSKLPSEYPDGARLPHVQVAEMMIKQGKPVQVGQRIPYVICKQSKSEASDSMADRAYPVEVFEKQADLDLDYEYYIGTQVFPPVLRLCNYLEGTSKARLADCLGIQKSNYVSEAFYAKNDESTLFVSDILESKVEDLTKKFKRCTLLPFSCLKCEKSINLHISEKLILAARNRMERSETESLSLFSCNHCKFPFSVDIFENFLFRNIRHALKVYYCSSLKPKTTKLNNHNSQLVSMTSGKSIVNAEIKSNFELPMSSLLLHLHFKYYSSLVDFDKAKDWSLKSVNDNNLKKYLEDIIRECGSDKLKLDELKKRIIDPYLNRNGRSVVQLGEIFSLVSEED